MQEGLLTKLDKEVPVLDFLHFGAPYWSYCSLLIRCLIAAQHPLVLVTFLERLTFSLLHRVIRLPPLEALHLAPIHVSLLKLQEPSLELYTLRWSFLFRNSVLGYDLGLLTSSVSFQLHGNLSFLGSIYTFFATKRDFSFPSPLSS